MIAEDLLAEALERMMSGQPPIYGKTWTTCLKIKRFLKRKQTPEPHERDSSYSSGHKQK